MKILLDDLWPSIDGPLALHLERQPDFNVHKALRSYAVPGIEAVTELSPTEFIIYLNPIYDRAKIRKWIEMIF